MTTTNNNQPASFVENEFNTSSDLKLNKNAPFNIRYDVAPSQSSAKVKEENVRVIRRYSFDDNGGGYQGL